MPQHEGVIPLLEQRDKLLLLQLVVSQLHFRSHRLQRIEGRLFYLQSTTGQVYEYRENIDLNKI